MIKPLIRGLLLALLVGVTPAFAQCGVASWYGTESCTNPKCLTASGEVFTGADHTAAMWGVPFGTKFRVTDEHTGKEVIVRINDRGPHKRLNRLIDLSKVAAADLGFQGRGLTRVCIEPL